MKHIKLYEELTNLSKVRKWPTYQHNTDTDKYFTYDLPKSEVGKYLNTWFEGNISTKGDLVYRDEVITLKKVDEETANRLYRRPLNPVSINILLSYNKLKSMSDMNKKLKLKGKPLLKEDKNVQDMKAQIHSIDDSSYGIWWIGKSLEELKEIRIKLMEWVNKQPILNGEDFLDYCVELGADEDQRDYN